MASKSSKINTTKKYTAEFTKFQSYFKTNQEAINYLAGNDDRAISKFLNSKGRKGKLKGIPRNIRAGFKVSQGLPTKRPKLPKQPKKTNPCFQKWLNVILPFTPDYLNEYIQGIQAISGYVGAFLTISCPLIDFNMLYNFVDFDTFCDRVAKFFKAKRVVDTSQSTLDKFYQQPSKPGFRLQFEMVIESINEDGEISTEYKQFLTKWIRNQAEFDSWFNSIALKYGSNKYGVKIITTQILNVLCYSKMVDSNQFMKCVGFRPGIDIYYL
jgi:hypothetical protein